MSLLPREKYDKVLTYLRDITGHARQAVSLYLTGVYHCSH